MVMFTVINRLVMEGGAYIDMNVLITDLLCANYILHVC